MKQNAPYLHQVTGTQRYKQNNELPFGQDSDKHIQGLRRQYVQFVSPTLQNGELAKQLLFTKKDGKGNAEKCVGTTEKHILLNTKQHHSKQHISISGCLQCTSTA